MRRVAAALAVGIAVLLIAFLLRTGGESRGDHRSPREVEPAQPIETDLSAPLEDAGLAATPRAPERVAVAEDTAARPAAVSTTPAKRLGRVRGRCVDRAARALPEVEISGSGLAESVRTAADGRFEAALDLFGQMSLTSSLRFARADLGARTIQSLMRAGEWTDLGDVVLVLAGRVGGRVVDAEGRALGGAEVRVEEALDLTSGSRFSGPEVAIAEGEAGANGRFFLADVPAGAIRVWAGAEEWSWGASERLELEPGGALLDLELVLARLEPADTIRLQVLDPSGAPVPHAEILTYYEVPERSGSNQTRADENGRYKQFLEVRATYSFQASDPEGRYSSAVAYDVAPGTHDLVLQLAEKRTFRLRVEDESGAPVARFGVRANQERGRFDTGLEPPEKGPPGEVEMSVPPGAFELVVEAEGYALAELGRFEPASMPRELVARLKALPGVRGRVSTAEGPLAGASVSLHRAQGLRGSYTVNGFPCFMENHGRAAAETGADGEYVLSLRESGEWYVRAEAPGFAPRDLGPLHIEAEVGARAPELVLDHGGTIAGRVIVPAGEDPSGRIVGLSRGDGRGFTGRTDAAGEYSFAGLTRGNWQVAWRKSEISTGSTSTSSSSGSQAQEIPWDCVVHEGRTTRFDLDLRALELAKLSGRFLLGGKAPPDWTVRLSPRGGPRSGSEAASLDADGRFRLTTTEAGSYQLEFSGLGTSIARASTPIELVPGDNVYEADVPVGGLRGHARLALLKPDARLGLVSEAYPGLAFRAGLVLGPDGSFGSDALPAGPARLEYTSLSGQRETKTLDIPRGESVEVDVP